MNFFNKAKKSLGQNFLIDKNIIDKIIEIGNITKNKTILEIGSGYGNLTSKILDMNPKKVIAIEKDKNLALHLKNIYKNFGNIKIINNDIFNFIDCNYYYVINLYNIKYKKRVRGIKIYKK